MWIKRSLFLFLKYIFFFFFLHARRRVIYRHICLSLEKINSSWCSGQKRGEAVPSRLQRGTTPLAASSPRSASQWPGAWGWFWHNLLLSETSSITFRAPLSSLGWKELFLSKNDFKITRETTPHPKTGEQSFLKHPAPVHRHRAICFGAVIY